MAVSCPNKTSPEWKRLVSVVGDKDAMKLYITNDDIIVTPELGQFQLFAETNPSVTSEILEQSIPAELKSKINQNTTLNDLISMGGNKIYSHPQFLSWLNKETGLPFPVVNQYGVSLNDYIDKVISTGTGLKHSVDLMKHYTEADGEWMYFNIAPWKAEFQEDEPNYINKEDLIKALKTGKISKASTEDILDYPITNEYGVPLDDFIELGIENGKSAIEILQDIKSKYFEADGEWLHFNYSYGRNWTPEFLGDDNGPVPQTTMKEVHLLLDQSRGLIYENLEDILAHNPEASMLDAVKNAIEISNLGRANEIAYKMAVKLSNQTGVPYQVISPEEANTILQRSQTPYRNQAAFFYDGKAYFVSGRMTLGLVFHEFAHPIIGSIRLQNRPLFEKLYNDVANTPEGQMIIEDIFKEYPQLEDKSDLFMEEVIVHALEYNAQKNRLMEKAVVEETISERFSKVVREILYQIKQALRKAFGKVRVHELKSDTTLDELADMLVNNDFSIDIKKVTDKDMAMFAAAEKGHAEYLAAEITRTKSEPLLQNMINALNIVTRNVKRDLSKYGYKEVKELLGTSEGGLINQMAQRLSNAQSTNLNEKQRHHHSLLTTAQQATSLIGTLATLKVTAKRVSDELQKMHSIIEKDKDVSHEHTKNALIQAQYYSGLLNSWKNYITATREEMKNAGIETGSSITQFVGTIEQFINEGITSYHQIQEKGAIGLTTEWLRFYKEKIDKSYDDKIAKAEEYLKKNPGSKTAKAKLEDLKANKAKFSISKEKIRDMYKGKLGDANWWSSMFESYVNNPDPIIGSFALFLKNNLSRIQEESAKRSITFRRSANPLLQSLGITGNNLKQTWDFALQTDTSYGYNDKGELVKKPVLAFKSSTKDGRYELRELEDKYNAAKDERTRISREKEDTDEWLTQYNIAQSKVNQAYTELEKEKRLYWNQEYKSEYYAAQEKLYKVTTIIDSQVVNVGLDAWLERSLVLNDISQETGTIFSEYEAYNEHDSITQKWKNYSQLYSLYYPNGEIKQGLDLLKAKALNDHRVRMGKFHEYIDIQGAFVSARKAFEDELAMKEPELTGSGYDEKVKDWVMKNTNAAFSKKYYEDLSSTLERLESWTSRIPAHLKDDLDVSDEFKKISSLITQYKDEFGEPDGTQMKDTKQFEELRAIQEALNEKERSLLNSKLVDQLSPEMKQERIDIFQDLAAIRGKVPTSYYLDIMNHNLGIINAGQVTTETINDLLRRRGDEGIIPIEELLKKSVKFRDWFELNHVKKYYKDRETGKIVYSYQRLAIWSVPQVTDDKYTVKFSVTLSNGTEMNFDGRAPSIKYKKKVVKNQYRTVPFGLKLEEREQYIGGLAENPLNEITDNKGNYLPKNKEQLLVDKVDPSASKYINQDYYKLKESNAQQFELLRKLTRYHLENQRGIDSKLYLDIPRFRIGNQRLDTQEQIESGRYWDEVKQTWVKIYEGVKATTKGLSKEEANAISYQAGDYEQELSTPEADEMDPYEFMNSMEVDSTVDKVPIQGTSSIPIELVSRNILKALDLYMMSATKQRVYNEISPLAKAVVDTLNNTANNIKPDGSDQANVNSYVARQMKKGLSKEENVRAATAKALYNREFKGKIFSEKHLDWLNKVTSKLMKGASFNYFALNLPSAIKNYWGALWQMNMEAIGGEHMDVKSYSKAKVWTEPAKMDWMNHIYGGDNFTLSNQMIMLFDPMQGKMEDVFGEQGTRTTKGDLLSLSWMYSPRKFMEFEASLQLFSGMMYHKQVSQVIDGKSIDIPYIEAFELDAKGDMKLKDGIDKEYEVGGKRYLEMKNLIHEKAKDLNGAFAKFEQPQAQAHFAYRLIMFMRRYFTTMFMNRFAKKRASIITGTVKTGFYVESVKTIAKIIGSYGEGFAYINMMEDSEKIAVKKLATEVAQIMIVSAIIALMFGWDDDDEERFAKMEHRSGALGSENFNLPGFLSNHLLVLLMKTSNENETFIPLPGFGLNDYTRMAGVTSIAFGPTITSYAKILTDIANHAAPGEDSSLFYKRDMGPYPWQQRESAKVWSHIGAMIGVTGSDVDPEKAARSFASVQNKWN